MSSLAPETRTRLTNLNDLLKAIYDPPRRMSEILDKRGLSDDDIARLRQRYLDIYLADLLQHYAAWLVEVLSERQSTIIIPRYGLDGEPRLTLRALGEEMGISRERVRQIQIKAQKRLKSFPRTREFEAAAVEIARRVLDQTPDEEKSP